MDDRLRQQLEQILDKDEDEVEEQEVTLFKQALELDIPLEDARLRGLFRKSANYLKVFYGPEEANRTLPWLLFSLGVAWERRRDVIHPE